MSADERTKTQTQVRKRAQKSAKGRKRAQKCASAKKLQTTSFESTRFGNSQKSVRAPKALTEINFDRINFFRCLVSVPIALPKRRGSYWKGALTGINSSGIIFGALAGIPGKSPGELTENKHCHRIVLVIISPGGGVGHTCWLPIVSRSKTPTAMFLSQVSGLVCPFRLLWLCVCHGRPCARTICYMREVDLCCNCDTSPK